LTVLKQSVFYTPSGIRTQGIMHPAGGKACPLATGRPPGQPPTASLLRIFRHAGSLQRSVLFPKEQQYGQMGQSS